MGRASKGGVRETQNHAKNEEGRKNVNLQQHKE